MKSVTRIDRSRLDSVKFSYNTARIDRSNIKTLLQGEWKPKSGDLLLARIVDMGQHSRLELAEGRKSHLFIGEEVVICYGNSYIPDQYEAVVPHSLELCSLVAPGGIAAKMLSYHEQMKMPTSIEPLGLLGDHDGNVINLAGFSLPERDGLYIDRPFTIAVAGTGMSAGKTVSAAYLTRGLSRSGLSVGAARITGTGTGKYIWHMQDAGAMQAIDITDAGLPSTYLASQKRIQAAFSTLMSSLSRYDLDVIVLEVADSIYQKETAELLKSSMMKSSVDAFLFAAGDSPGAVAGVKWLEKYSLPVVAVTGSLTRSPMAVREVRVASELPILDREGLTTTNWKSLLERHTVDEQADSAYRISLDRLQAIMAMPRQVTPLC